MPVASGPAAGRRRLVISGAALLILLGVAAAAVRFASTPPPLKIKQVVQVTSDQRTKGRVLTDGTRLYYAAGGSIMEARLAFGPGVRVVGADITRGMLLTAQARADGRGLALPVEPGPALAAEQASLDHRPQAVVEDKPRAVVPDPDIGELSRVKDNTREIDAVFP